MMVSGAEPQNNIDQMLAGAEIALLIISKPRKII